MMDKAVLTVWAVYIVGFALYPLMESLVNGFSWIGKKNSRSCDYDLEMLLMVIKSMFWPIIAVMWLWALWVNTLSGAGEWVHDLLADEYNKHRRDK